MLTISTQNFSAKLIGFNLLLLCHRLLYYLGFFYQKNCFLKRSTSWTYVWLSKPHTKDSCCQWLKSFNFQCDQGSSDTDCPVPSDSKTSKHSIAGPKHWNLKIWYYLERDRESSKMDMYLVFCQFQSGAITKTWKYIITGLRLQCDVCNGPWFQVCRISPL